MALDVKTNRYCALCRADHVHSQHDIRNCKKYATPSAKLNKLKSIKGCMKCGFSSHESKNWQYKFISSCMNCNSEHMTSLCMQRTQNGNNNKSVKTGMNAVEKSMDNGSFVSTAPSDHNGENLDTN